MNKILNVHSIWLVMMLLTISTYVIGKSGINGMMISLFLLATAAIKSYFVIADFMELRGVSLIWRIIMYGWLWTVCTGIGITLFIEYLN